MNLPMSEATWPSRVSRSMRQTDRGAPASREARAIEPASRIEAVDFPEPPLLDVTVMLTWPGTFGRDRSSWEAAAGRWSSDATGDGGGAMGGRPPIGGRSGRREAVGLTVGDQIGDGANASRESGASMVAGYSSGHAASSSSTRRIESSTARPPCCTGRKWYTSESAASPCAVAASAMSCWSCASPSGRHTAMKTKAPACDMATTVRAVCSSSASAPSVPAMSESEKTSTRDCWSRRPPDSASHMAATLDWRSWTTQSMPCDASRSLSGRSATTMTRGEAGDGTSSASLVTRATVAPRK